MEAARIECPKGSRKPGCVGSAALPSLGRGSRLLLLPKVRPAGEGGKSINSSAVGGLSGLLRPIREKPSPSGKESV